LPAKRLLAWLGLGTSKFHDWKARYGMVNEHNGQVPRDWWLEDWEKQAILDYHDSHPLDGYRRLAFMMLDDDIVAVSPSSVYRVLKRANRLDRKWQKTSKKGTGFVQPLASHKHWHVDISYLNLGGTFYYLCSILDGYSRFIVHWEIRESMTEQEVETIIQRALEKHPGETPRIISDNGPQFIAKDFKTFIRLSGMTHVRTSPYYPQSNGKLERWHGSIKRECIRPAAIDSLDDARRLPRLLRGIPCKVNLIPMNPHPDSPYQPPEPDAIDAFVRVLARAGMRVTLRRSRGDDIGAACGQLALRRSATAGVESV